MTTKEAIGYLAEALGMWLGTGRASAEQAVCFTKSVLKLAYSAGVSRKDAIQPFDLMRPTAERLWSEIECESRQSIADRAVQAWEIVREREWFVWPVQDGTWACGTYQRTIGAGVDPIAAALEAEEAMKARS